MELRWLGGRGGGGGLAYTTIRKKLEAERISWRLKRETAVKSSFTIDFEMLSKSYRLGIIPIEFYHSSVQS